MGTATHKDHMTVPLPRPNSTAITEMCQQHPVPHPEPSINKVRRARDECREALDQLALVQHELSTRPGTDMSKRPEWWLNQLQFTMGHLLLVMEDDDASRY